MIIPPLGTSQECIREAFAALLKGDTKERDRRGPFALGRSRSPRPSKRFSRLISTSCETGRSSELSRWRELSARCNKAKSIKENPDV